MTHVADAPIRRAEPTEPQPRRAAILIVEDDLGAARMVADVLESIGYQVRRAVTGAEARAAVERARPDLIILDLVLPDEDGLVLCSSLKGMANSPILVCSGTQRKRDAFLSLKLGADDFIAKPFDLYDFTARVEALLRRAAQQPRAELPARREPIRIGELLIDDSPHQVTLGGAPIQLTPTEYRLLSVLASRPDQVVPRELLAELVWGDLDAGSSRTIDVHIGRLRMKLSRGAAAAPAIISVRGFGYKILSGSQQRPAPEAAPLTERRPAARAGI